MSDEKLNELERKISELQAMVINLQKENITLKGQATTEEKPVVPAPHIELEKTGTPVRRSAVTNKPLGDKKPSMEELTKMLAEGVRRKAW